MRTEDTDEPLDSLAARDWLLPGAGGRFTQGEVWLGDGSRGAAGRVGPFRGEVVMMCRCMR